MKKFLAYSAIFFYGLIFISSFNLTHAAIIPVTPLKDPNQPLPVITEETLPPPPDQTQQTQQTQPTENGILIPNNSGGTKTANANTGSSLSGNGLNGNTLSVNPKETPILEAIDADGRNDQACENIPTTNLCPNPTAITASILPKIFANQTKSLIILVLGTLTGLALWLLSFLQSHNNNVNRDKLKINRLQKLSLLNLKNKDLVASYNNFGIAVSEISSKLQKEIPLNQNEITKVKKTLLEIDLLGSKSTQLASRYIQKLLSQPNPPSAQEFKQAHKDLIKNLHSDLDLK